MKHLGDITKIHGYDIEPVDVITGGSPCQDLSVAGARKGLKHTDAGDDETTRSGLFMEQIRIVKEMRQRDRSLGRTGTDVRPRYMVWENVPGAFSSNDGRDFQTVLTEVIRVAEPKAPDVEMPNGGGKWPNSGCYYSNMGRWSVAYRTVDAQYWGTPQRRKRIALVADFNGLTAGDILFDAEYRGEAEEEQSIPAFGSAGGERGRTLFPERQGLSGHPKPSGTQGEGTAAGAESSTGSAGEDRTICLQGNGIDRADTAGCNGAGWRRGGSYTLNTIDRPAVLAVDCRNGTEDSEVNGTLQAKESGMSLNLNNVVRVSERSGGGVSCGNPWDSQSERVYHGDGAWHSLNANSGGGQNRDAVLAFAQNQRDEVRDLKDVAGSLAAEPGMKQQTFVAAFMGSQGSEAGSIAYEEEKAPTLKAGGGVEPTS